MNIQETRLSVLVPKDEKERWLYGFDFVIKNDEVKLTSLPDYLVEALWFDGIINITPLQQRHGVRKATMARAIAHLEVNFVTGRVKDKLNLPGAVVGNTIELYVRKDGKRGKLMFEGRIGEVKAEMILKRADRQPRQKEVDEFDVVTT